MSFILVFSPLSYGEYGVYGHGNETCTDWLKDSAANPPWGRIIKHAWVLGYVTAFNNMQELNKTPLKPTDGAAISQWIDAYCRDNTEASIEDAALALVGHLTR